MNTNAPIAKMPTNCTPKSPPAAIQTARVPQIAGGEEVGRHRADDVVQLDLLEELEPEDDEQAADGADDDRPVVIDDVGTGGNRDEPRDSRRSGRRRGRCARGCSARRRARP